MTLARQRKELDTKEAQAEIKDALAERQAQADLEYLAWLHEEGPAGEASARPGEDDAAR